MSSKKKSGSQEAEIEFKWRAGTNEKNRNSCLYVAWIVAQLIRSKDVINIVLPAQLLLYTFISSFYLFLRTIISFHLIQFLISVQKSIKKHVIPDLRLRRFHVLRVRPKRPDPELPARKRPRTPEDLHGPGAHKLRPKSARNLAELRAAPRRNTIALLRNPTELNLKSPHSRRRVNRPKRTAMEPEQQPDLLLQRRARGRPSDRPVPQEVHQGAVRERQAHVQQLQEPGPAPDREDPVQSVEEGEQGQSSAGKGNCNETH